MRMLPMDGVDRTENPEPTQRSGEVEIVPPIAAGAALTPAGAAALALTELGRYLALREQRLRLTAELGARRAALDQQLRRLEVQRQANETYLEAQCRDRAGAREAAVAAARELIDLAGRVVHASCATTGRDAAELRRLARESIAAATAVLRDNFPAGNLAVIADAG